MSSEAGAFQGLILSFVSTLTIVLRQTLNMKILEPSDQPDMGFQIAPMIDVVFVIMLFFMVMAGAMKTERYLPAQLPGLPTNAGVKTPDLEIILGVHEDDTVSLNEEVLDAATNKRLPALTAALQRLKSAADQQTDKILVTIEAESEARYERVIDALNALAKAEIGNITFAVAGTEPF
jgi:biopolymer transport protein ExbD